MEYVSVGIIVLGLLINVIGYLWLLVEAFRTHPLWGLACLLLPPVVFVFFICNFKRTWKPYGLAMLGLVVSLIGALMLPPSPPG